MIGVIIVGYKNRAYLEDCFSSLFDAIKDLPVKVYFVDNDSGDGSVEYVRNTFPKVDVIDNRENSGFAKGNNIGIKRALEDKVDYVFLLNPDTVVDKKCLEVLAKEAREDLVIQPLILIHKDGKKTELVNTSGNYLNYLGISYCGDYMAADKEINEKEIAGASGAGVFFPRIVLEKIGLFDENFFMYNEDMDLSWRARAAGYSIKVIPQAVIWHKYRFGRNNTKFFYSERNRLMFMLKNFSWRMLLLVAPVFVINEILIWIFALKGRWLGKKMRSYGSVITNFKHIRTERKLLAKIRKKKDRDLLEYIGGKIGFSEVKIPLIGIYNWFFEGYWKLIKKII